MRRSASRTPAMHRRCRGETPDNTSRRLAVTGDALDFQTPDPACPRQPSRESRRAPSPITPQGLLSQPTLAARWDGSRLAPTPLRTSSQQCQTVMVADANPCANVPALVSTDQQCQPNQDMPDCPVCLTRIDCDAVCWTWHACGHRLHLPCAAATRLHSVAPPCPLCRQAWNSEDDPRLIQACSTSAIDLQSLRPVEAPSHANAACAQMPHAPRSVLPLCCHHVGPPPNFALLPERAMRWAPLCTQTAGPAQTIGMWLCLSCSREVQQSHPVMQPPTGPPCCPEHGPQCFIVDFTSSEQGWACVAPGYTPHDSPYVLQCPTLPPTMLRDHLSPVAAEQQSAILPANPNVTAEARRFFSAAVPHAVSVNTNSFLYCPILLAASNLLVPQDVESWSSAVHWFAPLVVSLSNTSYDMQTLAQAYNELLQITLNAEDNLPQPALQGQEFPAARAIDQLAANSSIHTARLDVIVPAVVDARGHIPNLLQDLLLQTFAGIPVASALDQAAEIFRQTNTWPDSIPGLPDVTRPSAFTGAHGVLQLSSSQGTPCGTSHQLRAFARAASAPPSSPPDPAATGLTCAPTLHRHCLAECLAARCGMRRQCTNCQCQINYRALYYRCDEGCRVSLCQACVAAAAVPQASPLPLHEPCRAGPATEVVDHQAHSHGVSLLASDAHASNDVNIERRGGISSGNDAPQPPLPLQCQQTHSPRPEAAQNCPNLHHRLQYGAVRYTRYVDMSLDDFVRHLNQLVAQGRFAHLGVPQVRLEGTTSWGVWLRINHRVGAFSQRPRLLCGALFHAVNRTVTLHGDAATAATGLLPVFRSWTYENFNDLPTVQPPNHMPLDDHTVEDLDALSSDADHNLQRPAPPPLPCLSAPPCPRRHSRGAEPASHANSVLDPAARPVLVEASTVPPSVSPNLVEELRAEINALKELVHGLTAILQPGSGFVPLVCPSLPRAAAQLVTEGQLPARCELPASSPSLAPLPHEAAPVQARVSYVDSCRHHGCQARVSGNCTSGSCREHCNDCSCSRHFSAAGLRRRPRLRVTAAPGSVPVASVAPNHPLPPRPPPPARHMLRRPPTPPPPPTRRSSDMSYQSYFPHAHPSPHRRPPHGLDSRPPLPRRQRDHWPRRPHASLRASNMLAETTPPAVDSAPACPNRARCAPTHYRRQGNGRGTR